MANAQKNGDRVHNDSSFVSKWDQLNVDIAFRSSIFFKTQPDVLAYLKIRIRLNSNAEPLSCFLAWLFWHKKDVEKLHLLILVNFKDWVVP